ncbi:MAG TPA: arsenate reductase ArsC [Candidatus Binatia bacterium]|nr:arsenate reductase ArsC [Candidatus Binatia bacterium]
MNPNKPHFKILFLCTGNSARSIFAEYLLKEIAPVRFEAYSAGASPKPAPHPLALEILRQDFRIDASDAYSKSWEEFKEAQFDFVITLCDNAKETCPVWPGQPILAHWSSPDPAAVEGSAAEKRRAFWQVAQQIKRRLELLPHCRSRSSTLSVCQPRLRKSASERKSGLVIKRPPSSRRRRGYEQQANRSYPLHRQFLP